MADALSKTGASPSRSGVMRIMTTRQYRPSRSRRFLLPAVTAVFLAYFAYHAFHGEYGIVGRQRLETQMNQLTAQLARLKAERAALENRVMLMRSGHLDQDMVDERAREQLNMVNPNEVVILIDGRAEVESN